MTIRASAYSVFKMYGADAHGSDGNARVKNIFVAAT
jgi:hypothetical protein